MAKNLRELIEAAPDFRVVQRGETPRETARNVYDAALSAAELPADEDNRDGFIMAMRAAGFLLALLDEAEELELSIMHDMGFYGGVVPVTLDHTKELNEAEALKLWNITHAVYELKSMCPEVLEIYRQAKEKRSIAA